MPDFMPPNSVIVGVRVSDHQPRIIIAQMKDTQTAEAAFRQLVAMADKVDTNA